MSIDKIYEAVDCTDDERYFTLGVWLTLQEATAAIDVEDPTDLCSDGCIEELAVVEIRERAIGHGGIGKKVYARVWESTYNDHTDEFKWTSKDGKE